MFVVFYYYVFIEKKEKKVNMIYSYFLIIHDAGEL